MITGQLMRKDWKWKAMIILALMVIIPYRCMKRVVQAFKRKEGNT